MTTKTKLDSKTKTMNEQIKMKIIRGRWESKTSPLHICKCGLCFDNLEDWKQHKKDTKSWRKYHERVNLYGIYRVVKRRKEDLK